MALTDYVEFDAVGLARLVATGAVTPLELVEDAIRRIERHNPALNAVVTTMYDQARAMAAAPMEGPLRGVPFLLKDYLGDYAGVETRQACRFLSGTPAPCHATLTSRFLKAGLIPLGKTNVPELALLPTTESLMYGPACNPWNTDHSTGGSSGGAAAAVAAGIVPLAHANDMGGSIRIPASACGLVGLKPTRGRNPAGPHLGENLAGLNSDGVVSRTVRDTAAVLDQTHGPEVGDIYHPPPPGLAFGSDLSPAGNGIFLDAVRRDPGRLRIAFQTRDLSGHQMHPECIAAILTTARQLEALGHIVEEVAMPVDGDMVSQAFMAVFPTAASVAIEREAFLTGKTPTPDQFEPLTWAIHEQAQRLTASQYQLALSVLHQAARTLGAFHQDYDVVLTTTLGMPPMRNGVVNVRETDAARGFSVLAGYVPFTWLSNATGQPSISLPLHQSMDRLPIGVLLSGAFGADATLLSLAAQLEEAMPWRNRRPPIWD